MLTHASSTGLHHLQPTKKTHYNYKIAVAIDTWIKANEATL